MPIAITLLQIQENLDSVSVVASLVFSGVYPAGGDVLDWTTVSGLSTPNGRTFVPAGLPAAAQISNANGRDFAYLLGTSLSNAKVKILTAADTELGAGAYAAGITGDTNIFIAAEFPKLL